MVPWIRCYQANSLMIKVHDVIYDFVIIIVIIVVITTIIIYHYYHHHYQHHNYYQQYLYYHYFNYHHYYYDYFFYIIVITFSPTPLHMTTLPIVCISCSQSHISTTWGSHDSLIINQETQLPSYRCALSP